MENLTGNADKKSTTTSKNDKSEENARTGWDENKKQHNKQSE